VKRRASAAAALNLAGLGFDFPRQATLETLELLKASDIIANNLSNEGALEFLALFCKDVRPIEFSGDDAGPWADKILAMTAPGKVVTFLTRGHPLNSGHLAEAVIQKAAAAGVEVRSFSAISTIDEALCVAQETIQESARGLQIYDVRLLMTEEVAPQTRIPALIYIGVSSAPGCEAEVSRAIDRLEALARTYPKDHSILVHSPEYGQRRVERVPSRELGAALRRLAPGRLSSVFLYFPAVY